MIVLLSFCIAYQLTTSTPASAFQPTDPYIDSLKNSSAKICRERWDFQVKANGRQSRGNGKDPQIEGTQVRKHNTNRTLHVHVGKTGGTEIHQYIRRISQELHVHALVADMIRDFETIVISLRNPVDRLISAYYFTHPLLSSKERLKPSDLLNATLVRRDYGRFYYQFPTLKDYGDALFETSERGDAARHGTGHINMDMCAYMGGVLSELWKVKEHVFIVNTESMIADLKDISMKLDWNIDFDEPHDKANVNSIKPNVLSMQTYMQLAGFLEANGEILIYNTLKANFWHPHRDVNRTSYNNE